ncbi:MAG: hypothetical protein FJ211_10695 [Ignavibacteria bacterium]|nr:hypothetical protein [Ignavibacteria bacterium]
MESSRPRGRCERFLEEDNLVRGLDGESISFGTDEHELFGLIGLAAPAISDGSGGEKVISYEDFVLAFDLAFEASKEGVLDGAEIAAVAIPALGLLRLPFGFWRWTEGQSMWWQGSVDCSAFE